MKPGRLMVRASHALKALQRRGLVQILALLLALLVTSLLRSSSRMAHHPPTPHASATSRAPVPTPPRARRQDLVEILHGVPVADPYRWLEDGGNPEVQAWSAAQTAYTEGVLESQPGFPALRQRIDQLLRIGSVEPPAVVPSSASGTRPPEAPRYFYQRQGKDQDQPVLYTRDGQTGAERSLIDPNALRRDGTTALDWWSPSWDGRLLAYGLSDSGSENSTLRVLDVTTGKDLPATEVITRARYASVAWLPDGTGFYYSRYPAKGTVPEGEEQYHRRIYFHVLGRDADHDPVVFSEGRSLTDMPSVEISPDGRWLVAVVHMGWSRHEAYLLDRSKIGPSEGSTVKASSDHGSIEASHWIPLAVPETDAIYEATPFNDHLLVRTNDGAPTFRVFRVDPVHPERNQWRELIPATKDVLASASSIGGDLFVTYIVDARSVVRRFAPDGTPRGEIPLPTLGTVHSVGGAWNGREAFFDFTSFAVPSMVFRLDLDTGASTVWAEVKAPIDPAEFVVEQERASSKDGTSIPMFISHRKGLVRDGTAPTILSGYGGFNISQMPAWSGARYAFLEHGGVSVVANLRGGSEYGEAWHKAGMLGNKQNVFDDMIAAAEHIIAARVTSPDKLAILGGSNGGLLVGAVITQRPDLFRAAVCMVPLLDMVRYHRFLIAKLWIPEYGSSDDPEPFKWLYAYSPYHHVVPGTRYPAMLLSTAESDSRVDPLHARKMAALLQAETGTPERPILLRIESRAGHGVGKPISKRIGESALIYSFLFWQLGMQTP